VAELDEHLAPARLVDLTQPLGPQTVLWPGSRPFVAESTAEHETHGGYARDLAFAEHSGTHVDAPAHISPTGLTVDRLSLDVLVRPAVRLDLRDRVGNDAAYAISAADVEEVEQRDGRVPDGCAVLVHTGWDRHLDDPERYGGPGQPAFPGLGASAAELLVSRGVVGIGIDTLGIDPGGWDLLDAHRITMPAGLWHVEGLVRLERVPTRGAWLVVGVLPIVAGSGAPARVFAIVP
jgi:kynurenine formamidase